jgi:peptidoglycan/xylan/chitin deacetylase (PgdA/CDA1 family)
MTFWPSGCAGAISLTFDDGMESHLSIALPALDARELRGTFYLNPRGSEDTPARAIPWRDWLARWLPAHAAGHEIGNHSIQHPCSLNIDVEWAPNLLDWTLEQIDADLREAQRRIAAVFPAQQATSFAYPCYESTVGRGARRASYTPIVAQHFAAGRARGDYANDPLFCDLHHLSSWPVERQPGAHMIGLAEQAVTQGRWGILTFHGIHEGNLAVGAGDFAELLDYLARRRREIWVAPVAEIASYIRERTDK